MTVSQKQRILLVDDNPAIHDDFRKILNGTRAKPNLDEAESILFGTPLKPSLKVNFVTESAFQGKEALEKLTEAMARGESFAMAFIDVRMPPGWDGIETAEALWKICPSLQIVLCTAYSDYTWEKMTERLGISENLVLLKKPFDNIEVLQLAHALTKKWEMTQAAQLQLENLEQMVNARTQDIERINCQLRQAQKMEAVGQLAAGVAHDFNNFLTIIECHASLQLALPGLSPDLRESFKQIEQAAERAAALTRQLLTFSKRQVIQPRVLRLNIVVSELSTMLRRLLTSEISLHSHLAEPLPLIFADRSNIEQIIMNLTLNARDAMPGGGVITISTEAISLSEDECHSRLASRPGDFISLSVHDTGIGMDPETASRIFEPFFTTKDIDKGTGMGLATVYGIVQQHDGWIEVETTPGNGSTFRVFLPVTEQESPIPITTTRPEQSPMKQTILIVEDEAAVRKLVKDILTSFGYDVLEAADAQAAQAVWAQHRDTITLLITDLVMPGEVKGVELADLLLAERPDLKVVYSSGYSSEFLKNEGKLHKNMNFLPKPYLSPQLIAIVQQAINGEYAELTD